MHETTSLHRLRIPALIAAGALLAFASQVRAMVRDAAAPGKTPPKQVIVRYRTDAGLTKALKTKSSMASLRKRNQANARSIEVRFNKRSQRALDQGVQRAQDMESLWQRTAIVAVGGGSNPLEVAKSFLADPNVEWAEPAQVLSIQTTPNDPSFGALWGLTKIQAPAAWALSQGSGTVVAVIDTGIDPTHPDLAANLWTNAKEIDGNGIDDDHNGFVDDRRGWNFVSNTASPLDGHSHGTHVSGTIAAVGNNGVGVIGVAPLAKIMPVKGLDDEGNGNDADLAKAIIYAADNGADVINMSWGGQGDSDLIQEAVVYAHSLGVVLVAAAGNSSMDVSQFLPAKYAEVIAVSAFNSADALAPFSNFGVKIDVAAPGVGILSTVPNGLYSSYNGTSMASPHVAGLAALILSVRPALTSEQTRQAIRLSADDVGVAGIDTASGYGRINALRALQSGPPPHVEISSPKQGAVVGPTASIEGSVDNGSFASRQLQYGVGSSPTSYTSIGSSLSTPVSDGVLGVWDNSSLPEGLYSLRLLVTTSDGSTLSHTVSPVRLDHTGPQFLSTFPSQGSVLPAALTRVTASVTDPYGVVGVQLNVDGSALDVQSPADDATSFSPAFDWVPTAGTHTIQWIAYDMAGNASTRTSSVTVIDDQTPPTLTLTTPADGSSVSGTVQVVADASDNVGVSRVTFALDGGAPFATLDSPPYQSTFSTLHVSTGAHTLTATAEDFSQRRSSLTVALTVVSHLTPPVLSPVAVTVKESSVDIAWTTDEPAQGRVEYGITQSLGLAVGNSVLSTFHSFSLTGLAPSTTYFFKVYSSDAFGNESASALSSFSSSDETTPLGVITSPEEGAQVSGTVSVNGKATDDNIVKRVDLLIDGHYWTTVLGPSAPQNVITSSRDREPEPVPILPWSETREWSYSLDSTQLDDGPHTITARSVDGADHSQDELRTIHVNNARRIAVFDPVMGVPSCAQPGASCASGGLLEARSALELYAEPNYPNTVQGACSDGTSGRYHTDESVDWLQVVSLDGGPLRAGSLARVDVKVWAYSTKNNYLDIYAASSLNPPLWTHVATTQPIQTRASVISSTFTLPAGGPMQAVRANFRYQGSAGNCSSGDYDDHDDLAFAVDPADVPPGSSGTPSIVESYAYPHPLTGPTSPLRTTVDRADRVTFDVYDMSGRRVLTAATPTVIQTSGETRTYEYLWNTDGLSAGTYYWIVNAHQNDSTIKSSQRVAIVK